MVINVKNWPANYWVIITGPMFAGKTSSCFEVLKQAKELNWNYQVFKHQLDQRYDAQPHLINHAREVYPAQWLPADNLALSWLTDILEQDVDLVLIDEAMFCTSGWEEIWLNLANHTRLVLVGIDLNSNGQAFNSFGTSWLALADEVIKLKGTCDSYSELNSRYTVCRSGFKQDMIPGGYDNYYSVSRKKWLEIRTQYEK